MALKEMLDSADILNTEPTAEVINNILKEGSFSNIVATISSNASHEVLRSSSLTKAKKVAIIVRYQRISSAVVIKVARYLEESAKVYFQTLG